MSTSRIKKISIAGSVLIVILLITVFNIFFKPNNKPPLRRKPCIINTSIDSDNVKIIEDKKIEAEELPAQEKGNIESYADTCEESNKIEINEDIEFACAEDLTATTLKMMGCNTKIEAEGVPAQENWNRENYNRITSNTVRLVKDHPLSTFSADVDTASYANIRRILKQGSLPDKGAVRVEEMINYFDYGYTPPVDRNAPFAVHTANVTCPWNIKRSLLKVGIKGKVTDKPAPPMNLVFLVDVSGSMSDNNKLPLVITSLNMLAERMKPADRIALAVYAGSSGLVLDSTSGKEKRKIIRAIKNLRSGGSTNGAAGIRLAYQVASKNFIENGVNRVILCTDGDFNVGTTSQAALIDLIKKKTESGVFLSVFGFGMYNLNDSMMVKLADNGNGNYGYIDTAKEAKKLLVDNMRSTLITIAKDVKIQVEFNPAQVKAYRLIGYEKKNLKKEDFNNDKKDAGEIGEGHEVTALYEIIPADSDEKINTSVDPLKYSKTTTGKAEVKTDEICTVKLRYKEPTGIKSSLITIPVKAGLTEWQDASQNMKFAASVAAFGMMLRNSEYLTNTSYDDIIKWAAEAKISDKTGYKNEFISLVKAADNINRQKN